MIAVTYMYGSSNTDPTCGLMGTIKYCKPSRGTKTKIAFAPFLKIKQKIISKFGK